MFCLNPPEVLLRGKKKKNKTNATVSQSLELGRRMEGKNKKEKGGRGVKESKLCGIFFFFLSHYSALLTSNNFEAISL